jgi:hypothetical protein
MQQQQVYQQQPMQRQQMATVSLGRKAGTAAVGAAVGTPIGAGLTVGPGKMERILPEAKAGGHIGHHFHKQFQPPDRDEQEYEDVDLDPNNEADMASDNGTPKVETDTQTDTKERTMQEPVELQITITIGGKVRETAPAQEETDEEVAVDAVEKFVSVSLDKSDGTYLVEDLIEAVLEDNSIDTDPPVYTRDDFKTHRAVLSVNGKYNCAPEQPIYAVITDEECLMPEEPNRLCLNRCEISSNDAVVTMCNVFPSIYQF